MKILKSLILAFGISSISIFAQSNDDLAKSRASERAALAAYKAKDYPNYLSNMKQASELRPDLPRLLYNLASAYALNGKADESAAILDRIASMGLYYDITKDDDFAALGKARINEIQRLLSANSVAINKSQRAFSISEKDLIPESVAYDPVDRRFYVGSIHKGKILAIDESKAVKEFSSAGDGLWSVSGMAVDVKRRILWATTTAFPQFSGFKPEDNGKAGVFKYDLKSGKLLAKYLAPTTEKHALGDLTLDRSGRVFVTDSVSPNIYTIAPDGNGLELFLRDANFSSLNGIAFDDSETALYVSDYTKGIFRIAVAAKTAEQLNPSRNVTLIGIDGLYFHQGRLIAIQNGMSPQRVVSFELDKEKQVVTGFRVLEANHIDFLEPTLGVIVDGSFYYIANSQWPLIDEKGVLQKEKLREPIVLKRKLR